MARAQLGLRDGKFALGWVGRLRHEKGADFLLTALEACRNERVSTLIIRDGPERAQLENDAAERLHGACASLVSFPMQMLYSEPSMRWR